MKKIRRALIIALALFAAALPVFGRSSAMQPISLTIDFVNGNTALPGARFDIYYAAHFDAASGYELVSPFAGNFTIGGFEDNYGWDELARQMTDFAEQNGAAPTETGITNANGRIRFPQSGSAPLEAGLYLVVGHDVEHNGSIYTSLPFLVLLPSWDEEDSSWLYAVIASPKSGQIQPTPTPAPGETPTPEPGETPTPEPGETPTPAPGETPTPAPGETPTPEPGETPIPTITPSPVPTTPPSPPTGTASAAAYGFAALLIAAGLITLARKRARA